MDSSNDSLDCLENDTSCSGSSESQSIIDESDQNITNSNISTALSSTRIFESNQIDAQDQSLYNIAESSGILKDCSSSEDSEVLHKINKSPNRTKPRLKSPNSGSNESLVESGVSEDEDASNFKTVSKKGKKAMVIYSDESDNEEKEAGSSRRSIRESRVENFSTPMKTNSLNLSGREAFSVHRSHKKKPIINSDSESDADENIDVIDALTKVDESDDESIVFVDKSDKPIQIDSDSDDIHNVSTLIKDNASDIINNTSDIIDGDSDQENIQPSNIVKKQLTIREMFKSKTVVDSPKSVVSEVTGIEVTEEEYDCQKTKISKLQMELQKAKNLQRTLNISLLPDKGNLLIARHENLMKTLASEEEKLKKMVVQKGSGKPSLSSASGIKASSWQNLEKHSTAVQPRTFGKKAMETLHVQKSLTMDRLHQLHGSLKACPSEDTLAEPPKGIKVELMPHQRRALAWLLWREQQKPSGGILADDMGLGKTLTMLSLMVKSMQMSEDTESSDEEDARTQKRKGGTLIVCPASIIGQWKGEVERRFKPGQVSVEVYHGTKRETNSKRLAEYDMVITTYSIVMTEEGKNTGVSKLKWKRIVLDEAHQIRNHKAKTAVAVCKLSAYTRWALTGTPIHNKELDIYALLKFLRVSPFDDLPVFKRWVCDKNSGGQERLNTVMSSIMLRRTKAQLQAKGALDCLLDREWKLIEIHLQKDEMDVYQKVLMFSRTLFAQYLHQRAEKQQDLNMPYNAPLESLPSNDPNHQYYKMHKKLVRLNRVKAVKQHEILVLLLRLRQICCHPSLITAMLEGEDIQEESDSEDEAVNILDQLNKLNIQDDDDEHHTSMEAGGSKEGVGLAEATRGILKPNHPIFDIKRRSTKVKALIKILNEKVLPNNDKAIIVSQWSGLLRLVAIHLREEGLFFDQLDGTVPVHKRAAMVDTFNNPKSRIKILLLSLTAGGVGLNLVGANHLLLLDLHWNPQLEMQAQDRIYRVGQQKPVYVYKFMALDTIEERIKALQDRKKNIAEGLLTGARITQNKLSLDDLKMLFSM